jgi:hypothetical protein
MPTEKEKKSTTIIGFGKSISGYEVKSHANDPFVIKKVEEASKTLQRVGFPKQKVSSEK